MARSSRPRPYRFVGLIVALIGGTAVALAAPAPAMASLDEWVDPSYGGWALTAESYSAMSNADAQDRSYVAHAERNPEGTITMWLRRLTSDGAIDPTFGGGRVALSTAASSPNVLLDVEAMHADAAGRLTVVYWQSPNGAQGTRDLLMRRFTETGERDLSFGLSGAIFLGFDISGDEVFMAFAARPGGGYFVAFRDHPPNDDLATRFIAALTDAGSLDPTWAPTGDTPGLLKISVSTSVANMAADGDRLLVLAFTPAPQGPQLRRLTATGAPDQTFATAGMLGLPQSGTSLTVWNGAYYIGASGPEGEARVMKVLPHGQLDGTFGANGVAQGPPQYCDPSGPGQVHASDLGITVRANLACTRFFQRFDLTGALDRNWGDEGSVTFDQLGGEQVFDIPVSATLSDGRIVGVTTHLQGIGYTHRPFRLAEVAPAPLAGSFVPLPPARILDTRDGTGVSTAGAVPGKGTVQLPVTGRGGVPATGVGAVVLNVTVTQPTAEGFVTAYPTGEAAPVASNLNFAAGTTIANLVTVKVGPDGTVTLRNGAPGTIHLIADVAGYYHAGAAAEPGTFVSLTPNRILDTRNGTGVAAAGAVPGKGTVQVPVTGAGGVPTSGVGAVVLNVTVTEPTAEGFATAYPTGETAPVASNLNFAAGTTIANLVTVKLGPDGTITLRNGAPGAIHLLADVAGYYLAGVATARGTFVPLTPTRILDTRNGTGAPSGPVTSGTALPLQIELNGGVPQHWVGAAVLNTTATAATADGVVVVYPSDVATPLASNLNFAAGTTIANLVVTKNGSDGRVVLHSKSPGGTVHLIADIFGYFNS